MACLYTPLRNDNRRCQRCNRQCKLFGQRDVDTRWFGWCVVCNAAWRMREVRSYLCCDRTSNINFPFHFGRFCTDIAQTIREYLFIVSSALIHRMTMSHHRRSLTKLLWTSARLDWFLADDSSEELEIEEQPMLWSLRHVYVSQENQRSYYPHLDKFEYADMSKYVQASLTLLDVIYTYINPDVTREREETTWQLFAWEDRFWLWERYSSEWFFMDAPPPYWRRYCYFIEFPRTPSTLRCWWYHTLHGRWFAEPFYSCIHEATYASWLEQCTLDESLR